MCCRYYIQIQKLYILVHESQSKPDLSSGGSVLRGVKRCTLIQIRSECAKTPAPEKLLPLPLRAKQSLFLC